jgi:competence protein ComEA
MKNTAFYTRRQAQGCYVLLTLLSICLLARMGLERFAAPPTLPASLSNLVWEKAPLASPKVPNLLCLEINQADSASWDSLPGIGPVLSRRIVRYRKKLGGFRSETQLQAVYGLKPETYQKIAPHLYFAKLPAPKTQSPKKTYTRKSYTPKPHTPLHTLASPLDLNQADSAALDALPGIGPKLASRILKYRKILGFYFDPDQLRAVYGLSEENFQRMRPHLTAKIPEKPPTSDLNTANQWLIARLAFWEKETADSLLAQRKKLGRFDRWEEIQPIADWHKRSMAELMIYFHL